MGEALEAILLGVVGMGDGTSGGAAGSGTHLVGPELEVVVVPPTLPKV